MRSRRFHYQISALLVVMIVFIALPAAVFLSGQTFGQRCAKAFPDDPARAELCVYNLSNGSAP